MTVGNSTRSNIIASVVIHGAFLALFAALIALFPASAPEPEPLVVVFHKPAERTVTPTPPVEPEPESKPEPPPPPPPEPEPKVAKVEPPPPPKPEIKPKPEPVKEVRVAQVQQRMEARPKKQVITKKALQPDPEPAPARKRARREVKTNLLNAAATQPATMLEERPRKTATGGFSAEAEAPRAPRKALRGGTKVGGFVVSDKVEPNAKPTRTVTQSSGFAATAPTGGSGSGSGNGATGTVATGGFGSTAKAERPRSERKVKTEKPDTPVEILSKPTPAYTSEARDLRVEGEVALRVTFLASGEIKVLEVLEELGHGLDEAAIDAAKRIRFKPARRDRQPVDHTVVLRIVFQLV